jgi:hypothetical protein
VLLECAGCGYQTSVTAGTILQDTRTPLAVWFRAMWWVTTQKNGASALGLQRVLGLKSYETAWVWLHKSIAADDQLPPPRIGSLVETFAQASHSLHAGQ